MFSLSWITYPSTAHAVGSEKRIYPKNVVNCENYSPFLALKNVQCTIASSTERRDGVWWNVLMFRECPGCIGWMKTY